MDGLAEPQVLSLTELSSEVVLAAASCPRLTPASHHIGLAPRFTLHCRLAEVLSPTDILFFLFSFFLLSKTQIGCFFLFQFSMCLCAQECVCQCCFRAPVLLKVSLTCPPAGPETTAIFSVFWKHYEVSGKCPEKEKQEKYQILWEPSQLYFFSIFCVKTLFLFRLFRNSQASSQPVTFWKRSRAALKLPTTFCTFAKPPWAYCETWLLKAVVPRGCKRLCTPCSSDATRVVDSVFIDSVDHSATALRSDS